MGALAKILTLVTLALQTLPLMEIRPASRIHQRFLTIATVRQSPNEEQIFVPCDALRFRVEFTRIACTGTRLP
jgi:hypothetical protein